MRNERQDEMSTNRRIVCSSTPASLRGSTRAVGCCSGSPGPRVPPWSSCSCSSRAREGSADVLRGRRTSPGARRRRTRVWMHDLRFPHSAPHGEALHPVRPVSWPPEYGCAVGAAHGRSRPDADQRPTGSGRPVERRLHGALASWIEYYNSRRRHSALGGHPPIGRLQPTS